MRRRQLSYWICALVLLGGVLAGAYLYHVRQGVARAEDLMRHQLWEHARQELQRYLTWFKSDARARLMYAESLAKDHTLDPQLAAAEAIEQLERIPPGSASKSEALARTGSLQFLVLNQPVHAERSLRSAVQVNPEAVDAYHMLWMLYDMTGRHYLTEPFFWRVYELTDEEDRIQCLREWYLGQFYPLSARVEVDRMMQFVGPHDAPDRVSESRRYRRYLEREAEGAMGYAGSAHWCQREGDLNSALQFINDGIANVPDARHEPFFLAVEIQILIDLGRFEEAEDRWRNWPSPKDGFEYWRATALVLDEVSGDYPEALKAYERALRVWPGPMEWRLRNRNANCLARAGHAHAAEQERQQAKSIEQLMADKVHERLYTAMSTLNDPGPLAEMVGLYRQLGREREAECWSHELERLQKASEIQP